MNEEIKYYSSLIVYFTILPVISGNTIFITLIIEMLAMGFIFLYRFLGDESLFYVYMFFSFLSVIPPFYTKNIYNFEILSFFYALLSLPIIHILIHKFERRYGKIDHASLIYYLSSLALSFFLVTLLLFVPIEMEVYTGVALIFILAALLYYLNRS